MTKRPITHNWGLALAGALFLAHAGWLSGLAEDAYISFRYSHNLAAGHGWVWNPGEAPVEGFTNLLWVLVGALVDLVGLPLPRTMQLLGLAAGLATLVLTDRFGAHHLGLSGWARPVPALLVAACGPLAAWSSSGLETVPFTLLVLATFYLVAGWAESGAGRALAMAGGCAALATLTRPDGVLVIAVLVAAVALRGWSSHRRQVLQLAAGLVLFLAALTLWRLVTFGAPLPNTFYAKTGGGGLQALRGAVYSGYFWLHFVLPIAALLACLPGRRELAASPPSRRPVEATALACLAGYGLLHTAYVVAVGGDYMAMNRFFVPILPLLYLLAGRGVAALLAAGSGRAPLPRLAAALVVLALAATAVQSTPLEAEIFAKAPRQHGTYRGVETERWHVRRLDLLARFFAERASARAQDVGVKSVATSAIGVIGYESGLAVYDFNGLVDPQIARGQRSDKPLGTGLPGHEKSDPLVTLGHQPTYWMFTRRLRDEPEGWPRYDDQVDEILRRDYEKVQVWLDDEANGESGYFTFLERATSR